MAEIPNIFDNQIDYTFIDCPYCDEENRFIHNIEEDMTQPHITVCKRCKHEIKFIERKTISFLIS